MERGGRENRENCREEDGGRAKGMTGWPLATLCDPCAEGRMLMENPGVIFCLTTDDELRFTCVGDMEWAIIS